jgi:hypothetical protein
LGGAGIAGGRAGGEMAASFRQEKLCGVLGILCFLFLSYPLLQIFNYTTLVTGIPLLFLYIFGVWVLAIIGLYVMNRRFASPDLPGKQEPIGHDH